MMFYLVAQAMTNWWVVLGKIVSPAALTPIDSATAPIKNSADPKSASTESSTLDGETSLYSTEPPSECSNQAMESILFALSGSPSSDAMAWLRLARPDLFTAPRVANSSTTPTAVDLGLDLENMGRHLPSSTITPT